MKPPVRAIFGGGAAAVQSLRHCMDESGQFGPRDDAWLQGARVVPSTLVPDEAAETRAAQDRLEQEIAKVREQRNQLESVRRRYLDALQQLERVIHDLPAAQVEDTATLAHVIAEAVVGRELAIDRKRTAALVVETLRMIDSPRECTVRINPDDLHYLREHHPELINGTGIFLPDEKLSAGGCVVETPKRIVDASVEARFDAVRTQLAHLLQEEAR